MQVSRQLFIFAKPSARSSYVLANLDPALDWTLRESATKAADQAIALIKVALEEQRTKELLVGRGITAFHPKTLMVL